MIPQIHLSNCALHNEPAYPAGECDCGAVIAEQGWFSSLRRSSCIRLLAWRNSVPSGAEKQFPIRVVVSSLAARLIGCRQMFGNRGARDGLSG